MGKDVKYWFPVLMHESSHMDQYIENDPTWVNNLGLEQTDKWIDGDDGVDLNIISEEIRTSMDVEINCEKRTIEKIKKFNLEDILDIDEYIQKSNAYILFYLWMKKCPSPSKYPFTRFLLSPYGTPCSFTNFNFIFFSLRIFLNISCCIYYFEWRRYILLYIINF